ncbi:aquaporin [Streptomyces sp. NBC_01275]|uniref:aquaporin n=1 Tax=Streptomyces sp. NBC_01275 TaxID=2903807 RepID=UPI002257C995|nr:aquaporin [Streptomyces sp. NBC_01275]MCX4766939.1 aquaporin [Streptomyces sp. NBC_01275]
MPTTAADARAARSAPVVARHYPLREFALTAVLLGPRSGGATNPARPFGPALLSGDHSHLAVHLIAPVLGSVLGAGIHKPLKGHPHARDDRLPHIHRPRRCGATPVPRLRGR